MKSTIQRIAAATLMALLAIPGSAALCSKSQHEAITDAHQKAGIAAEHLYEDVDHLTAIDKAAIRPQVDGIARALQQVREAEQTCTHAGLPRNKVAAWNYQQMIDHEQAAYLDLEELQKELAIKAPRLNHVISLIVDIRRQMDMAEEAHRDCKACLI
ncbi:MAG: hypothetical protein LAP21_15760 [Acidobacteriia bacterium]|nr:hypothetical protein [Terriglobia bacterium]